jgi:D-alanyl-D-alanine dipeptidase
MRNIIGFLVAIATAALAIFGYGYYNAKAENKTEVTIENLTRPIVALVEEVPVWEPIAAPEAKSEVAPAPAEEPKAEPKAEPKVEAAPVEKPKAEPVAPQTEKPKPQSTSAADNFDKKMREYGLVDIRTLDKSILVELKYSTTDNFVGKDMYGSLERAYLERKFAEKVLKAQQILRKRYPSYTLLIYDAARPISVQRTMKKIVAGTEFDSFVASGKTGGRHNYGVAVDLTIADKNGKALDMGTGFDSFDKASAVKGTPDNSDPTTRTIAVYRAFVRKLQADGLISKKAADNRILLLEVMHEAGLYPYRNEWWHFELINSMANIRETYRLLDF